MESHEVEEHRVYCLLAHPRHPNGGHIRLCGKRSGHDTSDALEISEMYDFLDDFPARNLKVHDRCLAALSLMLERVEAVRS